MPEKQPQYDEALKDLIACNQIVPYDDEVPTTVESTLGRMANCCGSSFFGVITWAGIFGIGKIPKGELATWNTEKIIVAGFVEPDELPTLKVARHFLRMKGNKKDFFVTWENV